MPVADPERARREALLVKLAVGAVRQSETATQPALKAMKAEPGRQYCKPTADGSCPPRASHGGQAPVATTASHLKTSLIQLLAQLRIELVPINRLIERDGSAFSLEIREDDGRPRTRVLARTVAEVRHDLASSDHIPSATSRCGLRSLSELIQYSAQIFAHFFFSIPAEIFSRRLSRLSVLMMNVQLQSGIVHFDLGHPYRRSAFAKIISHPNVARQKSIRRWLSDRGKSRGVLFSRSSIRRHRADGGAEERRGKRDWKRGIHDCASNAGF
jgi:hypothetical protein